MNWYAARRQIASGFLGLSWGRGPQPRCAHGGHKNVGDTRRSALERRPGPARRPAVGGPCRPCTENRRDAAPDLAVLRVHQQARGHRAAPGARGEAARGAGPGLAGVLEAGGGRSVVGCWSGAVGGPAGVTEAGGGGAGRRRRKRAADLASPPSELHRMHGRPDGRVSRAPLRRARREFAAQFDEIVVRHCSKSGSAPSARGRRRPLTCA